MKQGGIVMVALVALVGALLMPTTAVAGRRRLVARVLGLDQLGNAHVLTRTIRLGG